MEHGRCFGMSIPKPIFRVADQRGNLERHDRALVGLRQNNAQLSLHLCQVGIVHLELFGVFTFKRPFHDDNRFGNELVYGFGGFIWVNGQPTEVLAYFLSVSPGFFDTMRVPYVQGRDFREDESFPGKAIVNDAFVQQCFGGRDPIGKWFEKETGDGVTRWRFEVVGVVGNAHYRNLREPMTPTAYVPFFGTDRAGRREPKGSASFIVRTKGHRPASLIGILRSEVSQARPELRVSNIRTQVEINNTHTVRERLLAMLAAFFAAVGLLLAAVGVYGVLHYSVLQRQKEIGVRLALGARALDIAKRVTAEMSVMAAVGIAGGLAVGFATVHFITSLLYDVKSTDPGMTITPILVIAGTAVVAALPAVIRAVRIDPASMLRVD